MTDLDREAIGRHERLHGKLGVESRWPLRASMRSAPIVFAMANPVPEIMLDEARAAGAAVVGSGRRDFPNQINNVLAFPGVFRGALDAGTTRINEDMKVAAALALAALVIEPAPERILPEPLDPAVAPCVATAVADAARRTGVCR